MQLLIYDAYLRVTGKYKGVHFRAYGNNEPILEKEQGCLQLSLETAPPLPASASKRLNRGQP